MLSKSAPSSLALGALSAFLLLVGLQLAPSPAMAEDGVVMLPPAGTVTQLKQRAEYLPVSAVPEFDANALASAEFQPWDPAWEQSAPPMWVRLKVRPQDGGRVDWCLKLKRRFFPRLDVHVLRSDYSPLERYALGFNEYTPGRIEAQAFVLPVPLAGAEERVVLLRVETVQQSLRSLSLMLEDELTLAQRRHTNLWGFGLYFGSVIALLVYNLLLYLNLRTPGHRVYVATILTVMLFMGMDTGLLQGVLPAAIRPYEAKIYSALAALMMTASIVFFQVFTSIGQHKVVGRAVLHAINTALLALVVLAIFGPLQWIGWVGPATQIAISLATFVLLGCSVLSSLRGSREALIFTVAWSAFLGGSLVRSFVGTGLLPQVPAAEYMVYVGSVAEAMILALGLSMRVGELRERHRLAEVERERAVYIANADMLTGLHNRRFLSEFLTELFVSLELVPPSGALILFDLDHFKRINDTHGHDAGDAALVAVADRCLGHLREVDLICRLGGDEFAVVLHEVEGEEAQQAAERLHAAITENPVKHGDLLIPVGVSMGVLAPLQGAMDEAKALKWADEALYEAKRAGRNRVHLYREPGAGDDANASEVEDVG
ncbi:MAG: diguanylate cyclase [Pseudomonadota bacterium]